MTRRVFLRVVLCLFLTGTPGLSQITAGNCLRLDGTNGYSTVAHDSGLNPYPLTITAWVRTARVAPLYDAIVNKYAPGSGSGYSFHVYNGRLRGWYFRDGLNFVYPGDPGLDGGFIADGQWHHVAMVIGPGGGAIYIDGVSRGTPQGWTGVPGATTTVQPITIGRYSTDGFSTSSLEGDLDDVAIWSRALSLSELNYLKHRRLNGNEDGLLSLWRFNEGSGTSGADATAAGRVATLNGPVAWKPSAAPIALAMVGTNCLRFDGAAGYISVPHSASFNTLPFTAMGWFRTTNTASPLVQGIVSKYQDSSGNGWALIVQNNKLRGFYYRTLADWGMDIASARMWPTEPGITRQWSWTTRAEDCSWTESWSGRTPGRARPARRPASNPCRSVVTTTTPNASSALWMISRSGTAPSRPKKFRRSRIARSPAPRRICWLTGEWTKVPETP